MRAPRLPAALLVALPLLCGAAVWSSCAAAPRRAATSYGDRARRAYEEAMEVYNGGDLVDSLERFQRIKREFGLSRWGWLAELRIADIDLRSDRYTQGIQAYRTWIRYHPTQPEVPYAHFQIARGYAAQIPNEWFVIPPSWERDDSTAHDAEEELQHFVTDYPEASQIVEARALLHRVRELLARQELHIGQYYRNRDQWDAAVSRYRTILESYHDSGLEPEAMVRIGETFLGANRRFEARESFDAVLRNYPSSGWVISARNYLRHMGPPNADERRAAAAITADGGAPADAEPGAPVPESSSPDAAAANTSASADGG